MAQHIMVMGTGSHVGKSILATALCRILYQDGLSVAPFKAQNMALNSFVTKDGGEMGRAQVAQAEAAGVAPDVLMNPVLLKPTGNSTSQIIIMGKPVGTMSASDYHTGFSLNAFQSVRAAAAEIDKKFDALVIEGAGSPAEINLKDTDIVNMRVAKMFNAPVILVADIDRGGALAALVGTLELLDEEERALIKGFVINKFRGDVNLFTPAVKFLEEKTGKPVLGIVPYLNDIGIDDEDSVSLDDNAPQKSGEITLAVLRFPKISNFSDFAALEREKDVKLIYATVATELFAADAIILPGSKNTAEDLAHIKKTGMFMLLKEFAAIGKPIIGICGGYQMMGKEICDPKNSESDLAKIDGLDILPITTTFSDQKFTAQAAGRCENFTFLGQSMTSESLTGYEIHAGVTPLPGGGKDAIFSVRYNNGERRAEGCQSGSRGQIWGTYLHGIFDDDKFRRDFLNAIRGVKNLPPLPISVNNAARKEQSYNRLADAVRRSLNIERIKQIMSASENK